MVRIFSYNLKLNYFFVFSTIFLLTGLQTQQDRSVQIPMRNLEQKTALRRNLGSDASVDHQVRIKIREKISKRKFYIRSKWSK